MNLAQGFLQIVAGHVGKLFEVFVGAGEQAVGLQQFRVAGPQRVGPLLHLLFEFGGQSAVAFFAFLQRLLAFALPGNVLTNRNQPQNVAGNGVFVGHGVPLNPNGLAGFGVDKADFLRDMACFPQVGQQVPGQVAVGGVNTVQHRFSLHRFPAEQGHRRRIFVLHDGIGIGQPDVLVAAVEDVDQFPLFVEGQRQFLLRQYLGRYVLHGGVEGMRLPVVKQGFPHRVEVPKLSGRGVRHPIPHVVLPITIRGHCLPQHLLHGGPVSRKYHG